ncbi:MAG TPA: pyridoxamine 5'-phosphate oxidase family protein [Phytomonospora sp.]
MGKIYEGIGGRLAEFIAAQHVFFTATAPSGSEGHVNVSPKGMSGTFAILGEHRVAYLDYTGSGSEGLAHLRENGRICLMFCAFEGPPIIVRLHGRGEPVFVGDPRFEELAAFFGDPDRHGLRAIVDVEVTRVSDSCGYGVPLLDFQGDRDILVRYMGRKDDEKMAAYQALKNAESIDGLPALPPPAAEAR